MQNLEELLSQFKSELSSRQVFEWQKLTRSEFSPTAQCLRRQDNWAGVVPAINLLRNEGSLSAAWQHQSRNVENLPCLTALRDTTVRTLSTKCAHLAYRQPAMASTFRSRAASTWPISCGVARARSGFVSQVYEGEGELSKFIYAGLLHSRFCLFLLVFRA